MKEWRELRLSHPYEGSGVDWLERVMRLRHLEVVLIDRHGLRACFRNRLVFDGRDVGLATLVEVGG